MPAPAVRMLDTAGLPPDGTAPMQAVRAVGLRKRYGDVAAVDRVSLDVEAGEIFGLLGPNGAGKTTTVEMLEGLRAPDAGTVRVLGCDLRADPAAVRQRVGVQLQTTALYPRLTVREVLDLFRRFYAGATMGTDELIDLIGLQDKAGSLTRDLSGGQAQRLSVALALVNRPEMVFLDEPTTGLDPQARRATWDTIRDIRGRGATVLLTTHYMEEAEALCDRVAIMDGGRIIAEGPPARLVDEHFDETPIEVPVGGAELAGVPGVERLVGVERLAGVERLEREGGALTLYSSDTAATLTALIAMATAGRIDIGGLHVRRPTLEDVFLRLTGRRIRD